MDKQRLLGLLDGFSGKKLLVLGDMVADEYWFGEPTGRISREAPIPILRERSRQTRPGGATNPGYNARTLGADSAGASVSSRICSDSSINPRPIATRPRSRILVRTLFLKTMTPIPSRTGASIETSKLKI